jgi:hypothetical protein
MICWGKNRITHELCEGFDKAFDYDPRPAIRRRRVERIAERVATGAMAIFALYLLGHLIAAWLRGSFEVIGR